MHLVPESAATWTQSYRHDFSRQDEHSWLVAVIPSSQFDRAWGASGCALRTWPTKCMSLYPRIHCHVGRQNLNGPTQAEAIPAKYKLWIPLLLNRARRVHRSLDTAVDGWMYRLMRRVDAFNPVLLHARSFWRKGPEVVHASDWSSSIESSGQSLLDHFSASSPQSWPWVTRFCDAPGNELFARVPMEFIAEEFNWLGMQYDVDAISLILSNQQGVTGAGRQSDFESAAQHMYGLIHARYIITQKGLLAMREKFACGAFGTCPRVLCGLQYLLPVGLHDQPGRKASVKLYCPRCREVYQPENPLHRVLDGAYWGTTIPHLFLLAFPELDPHAASPSRPSSAAGAQHGKSGGRCCTDHACGSRPRYQPRVFGFRVKNSRQY